MAAVRPQIRIDTTEKVVNRAKAVAYGNGMSLTEFVLEALANAGDKELTKLIKEDIESRPTRGRPEK